jgi:hypothetical protein
MSPAIEIQKVEIGEGWRVWFGTWATDRVKVFATPQEAEAFALAKFKKMPSRSLIYPKDWPLCTSI